MHPIFSAETEIDAPLAAVWTVLDDFDSYSEWNPFTPKVELERAVGARVEMHVDMGRFGEKVVTERVFVWEPPTHIGWGMHLLGGALIHGVRHQELEALSDERTRYRTYEGFTGLIAGIVSKRYGAAITQGFESVAGALKARVESLRAAE